MGEETRQFAVNREGPASPRGGRIPFRGWLPNPSVLWLDFSVGCIFHLAFEDGAGRPTSISVW